MQLQKFIPKCGNYACIRIMIIFYIPLTSKKYRFQLQTSFLPGNNKSFLLSLLYCGSRFLKIISEIIFFAVRKLLQNFEGHGLWHRAILNFPSGGINGVKLWAYDEYSGAFPYKVTPHIDFTDEVVVLCDVPDVKILLRYWLSTNDHKWILV